MPSDPTLRAEAEKLGIGRRQEDGRTMGNVIMLKLARAEDRTLFTHELVHIRQQERLGRTEFLRRALLELATVGYWSSPLEREAYAEQSHPWATAP